VFVLKKGKFVEKPEKVAKETYAIGQRIDKFCEVCAEDRGHIVALVTKKGQISRVSCPKCGTRSTFKSGVPARAGRASAKASAPYDRTRTYRAGQSLMHPAFGLGEVTAVIEPLKIDVLFSDRVRRLIHARPEA
jgi:hypothetical protein